MTSRYRLAAEVHRLEQVDGKDVVVTEQRWDAFRAAQPRAIHLIIHNGEVAGRKVCASQRAIVALDQHMKELRDRVRGSELTEEQARAEITRLTGVKPAEWCYGARGDCSSPVPVGGGRCLDGHSTGRIGGGSLSGVRRRGVIVIDNRKAAQP